MFSLQIVDSDAFLDMPQSTQLLYFHLSMRADDEGFVGNPKKIMRMIGTSEDDMKVLLAKRFLLSFQSGVVVIKHWLIHNTIRMDRFNPTTYEKEKKLLTTKENKAYTEVATNRQPDGNLLVTQVKLSKVNLSKERESRFAPPSLEEVKTYCEERQNSVNTDQFYNFYSSKGWMVGRNKMKDWQAAIRTWEQRDKPIKTDDYFLVVGNHKFKTKEEVESASENGIIKWDNKERKWIG